MERVYLTEMTPPLLRERLAAAPVAYLPLGGIETSSEHLPLGAGCFHPQGLLCALAREVGGVVLPTLFLSPDGGNPSFQPFQPGNLFTTSEETFHHIMGSVLRNLPGLGVRVVVTHGSSSSTEMIQHNQPLWEEELGLKIFIVPPSHKEEPGRNGTTSLAVGMNTCLMMALCPDLVDLRYLSADRQVWPQGIEGPDPRSSAYAEYGERHLDAQVQEMATIIRKYLEVVRP